jgi:PKD repeat protein
MSVLRTLSISLIAFGSALAHYTAHAQDASTDCGAPILPQLCVDFDASRSVDAAARPLVYRWQMGDSTSITGFTVSHCYKRRARYQVVLDVLVPATGEVRKAEKTFEVDLLAQPVINFSLPTATVRVGQPAAFDALDSGLPTCQNVLCIWDFRDGTTQQGRRIEHTFRKAGRYQIRLSLRGYGPGDCASSHCATQEVVVVQ